MSGTPNAHYIMVNTAVFVGVSGSACLGIGGCYITLGAQMFSPLEDASRCLNLGEAL